MCNNRIFYNDPVVVEARRKAIEKSYIPKCMRDKYNMKIENGTLVLRKKKMLFVIKKNNLYLIDSGEISSDNYSPNIEEAEVFTSKEDAEDAVDQGRMEGIEGERVVPVTVTELNTDKCPWTT